MEESVLYPPNLRALSGTVITDVMQRVRPPAYSFPSDPSALLSLQKSQLPSVHLAVSLAARGCHVSQVTADLSTHQSELDKVALRRERNRMHQSRYKMKQLKKVEDLETSIQQLQEEVQQLKLKKVVISVGVMSNTTVWNVAAEYFRMFRYGVRVSGLPSRSVAVVATSSPFTAEAQRRFILSTMMASVTSETGHGVDALMENWGFVSKFHPDIDVQLVSLEYTADGLVIGKTLGRLTITENTLYHAFPHLIGAGEGEKRAEFARRLLGQQLVMRGAVHFDWDSENGRIARLHHKADLLTPLLELLGSLEEVSSVFENALVTPESTSVTWGKLSTQ
ncbi:hypothetical protein PC128_g7598 [Phytophthora cactorum]|nr:hypothetical protein PC128_g7598 [Phytophthora cactorum]